jgi:CheY-like chemotaxis protein
MPSRVRILIADDHTLVAELCQNLSEPEFEVVGLVNDGQALVHAAASLRPSVIIVDIAMPLLNGLGATEQSALAARAKLTFPDLERGFKDTEEIVLKMSSLYDGTIGELKYIGGDDYEVALDWIRRAKCAYIERYEHKFKEKWDGPRPKDCSRKDWELL